MNSMANRRFLGYAQCRDVDYFSLAWHGRHSNGERGGEAFRLIGRMNDRHPKMRLALRRFRT